MNTLIGEDLLLLLLDDESGKVRYGSYLQPGVGGALLVELALAGAVEVTPGEGWLSRAKVTPTGERPPQDPVLAASWAKINEKPRTAQDLVGRLGKDQRDVLLDRLADRGLLRRSEGRVLGLFPRTTWPAQDSDHETALRQQLADVLVHGAVPEARTAALVGVLSAMDVAHRIIDDEGIGRRAVKSRAKQVAEGDWAAKAVKDAITATQAAVAASVSATSAATAGAS